MMRASCACKVELSGVHQGLQRLHDEQVSVTAADLDAMSHGAVAQQLRDVLNAACAIFAQPCTSAASAALDAARSLRRTCEERRRDGGWDSGAWQECLIFALMCATSFACCGCGLPLPILT